VLSLLAGTAFQFRNSRGTSCHLNDPACLMHVFGLMAVFLGIMLISVLVI